MAAENKHEKSYFYQPQFIEDQVVIWPERLMICFNIFILAILLPIPVSIFNAALQLITFQPLQALKSLIGGVAATVGLIVVATIGLFPLLTLLNRITAYAFCSAKDNELASTETVETNKGLINKYYVSSKETSPVSERYSILFLGTLETYIKNRTKCDIARHTYVFHYPGVNNTTTKDYRLASSIDAVNAGIAMVYDLINKKGWSEDDIKKNLRLDGRSLGGGIAYQVALHFKKNHTIDIPVDGQNTFWSIRAVVAGHLKTWLNMPLWCGRLFSGLILSAAGGFELDTLDAVLQLNPECVDFNNIKYNKEGRDTPKSSFEKIYRFFWGSPHDADGVLTDSATLYAGVKKYATPEKMTQLRMSKAARSEHIYRETKGWELVCLESDTSITSVASSFFKKKVLYFKKGLSNHQNMRFSSSLRRE